MMQDLYDVSQGKKYALIISNTFPGLNLAVSQTPCRGHIGIDPKDDSGSTEISLPTIFPPEILSQR